MRSIAHHDNWQQSECMKFLRIIFGCPEGARKWRILFFAMLLHSKNPLKPKFQRICSRSKRDFYLKEPLNQSAAALSGSFAPTDRFENLEIHEVFLRFPNLNLEQNPSLTALAIESEFP